MQFAVAMQHRDVAAGRRLAVVEHAVQHRFIPSPSLTATPCRNVEIISSHDDPSYQMSVRTEPPPGSVQTTDHVPCDSPIDTCAATTRPSSDCFSSVFKNTSCILIHLRFEFGTAGTKNSTKKHPASSEVLPPGRISD